MKRGKVKKAAISVSVLLTATALLFLQLSGGGRVTASDSDQEVSEGVLSSRVIAQRDPVELIEQRDDHTRVWEIEKEVETTHPDGSRTVETVKSYIHEKGSGLCYGDASGNFVPSVAEWRETPDGFVIDRCGYWLSVGKSIGAGLRYIVDGHGLLLRAAYLMISDGVNEAHLAVLNANATGFIVPGSPSVVRFPSAFGPGYDLEYVAETGGFHQNLIIAQRPVLPSGFDAVRTGVHLYTEMNLDEYLAASALKVLVDGEEINASASDLVSPPSSGGCISFHRQARAPGEAPEMVHAFSLSTVCDSSGVPGPPGRTLAAKRLMKAPTSGVAFLVESVPLSYFARATAVYPISWDYLVVIPSDEHPYTNITGTETWYSGNTYWVTENVTVSGTLIIQRGAVVKLNPVTAIYVTTGGAVKAGTEGPEAEYAVFTKAADNDYGDPTGGEDGDYSVALYILTGANGLTDGCKIEYCKMRFGVCSIDCLQSLANPIQHNVILGENHIYYAIMVQCTGNNTSCKNNLIRDSNWHGIYYYEAGTANTTITITNNTVHHSNVGISLNYTTCSRATDNLLSQCSVAGISIYNSSVTLLGYNGYWNCGGSPPGQNNKVLQACPYAGYGQFFLDQCCALIDGGSRTASAADLASHTTSAGTNSTGGWTDTGTTLVDIGYHYSYLALMPYVQRLETYQIYENGQLVTKARATIMFHTTSGGTGYTGYVDYGTTPGYGATVSGSSSHTLPLPVGNLYVYEFTVPPPGEPGLDPNTLCYYRVRHIHDQDVQYSHDNTFYTKMTQGNAFRFLAYGDNRGGSDSDFQGDHFKVTNRMLTHTWSGSRPRFVLHCGDFVSAGGAEERWHPHFFDPAAGLLGSLPLWPCIGNHEYIDDGSVTNYKNLFAVPTGHPQHEERFFSFDYANCHFIVLDTGQYALEDDIGPNTHQYQWLHTELSNATGADWVVVLLHIPPYTDSPVHPYTAGDVTRVRTYLAPLFEDVNHPADLVIGGHNHLYERSQAERLKSNYWVHYIVTGGAVRDVDLHDPGPNNRKRVPYKALKARHFCTIDINGTTATLNVIKEDGTKFEDNVQLHPGQQWP
jgi:hypothetical protein